MYAVLRSPGRATDVQSDGGMFGRSQALGAALHRHRRITEISYCLKVMPEEYAKAARAKYETEKGHAPYGEEEAATYASMSRPAFRERLKAAYAWIEGRLNLPHR